MPHMLIQTAKANRSTSNLGLTLHEQLSRAFSNSSWIHQATGEDSRIFRYTLSDQQNVFVTFLGDLYRIKHVLMIGLPTNCT